MATRKTKESTDQNTEATEVDAEPLAVAAPEPVSDADLKSLDDAVPVEIEHTETRQRYGVTMGAYRELYEPIGYIVTKRADGVPLPSAAPDVPDNAPAPVFPQLEDAAEPALEE